MLGRVNRRLRMQRGAGVADHASKGYSAPSQERSDGSSALIRASELGEYGYCSRAWWYKHVVKLPVPDGEAYGRLAAGTQAHRRHGAWVVSGARLRALGIALALCGLLMLVVAVWLRS